MTVAKQPAVYTHTCDRCGDKVNSSDGDASGHGWAFLSQRGVGIGWDLCAECEMGFAAFIKGQPVSGVAR